MDSSSGGSNNSGTAVADESSTMAISSQALPTISHFMYCSSDHVDGTNNNKLFWAYCDSTDSTALSTISVSGTDYLNSIYLDDIHTAGFRPCPANHSGDGEQTLWCK